MSAEHPRRRLHGRDAGASVDGLRRRSVHETLEAAAAAVAASAAAPPPPADDVRRLLELRALEQLKARYFRLLDTRDWDAFRGLFTADARFESPGTQGGSVGVDRFLEIVREGWITKGSMHHGHTPELELTGSDTARGTWWMQTVQRRPGRARQPRRPRLRLLRRGLPPRRRRVADRAAPADAAARGRARRRDDPRALAADTP